MKKALILITFLITQIGFTQNTAIKPKIKRLKNDTIVWRSDSLLTKEDFKSKSRGSTALGFTCAALLLYPNENNGVIVFNVEAIFIKSKSYITKYSDYVLKHEQLHFDICEIYARKLRQKIATTDFKKVKKLAEEIQKMYTKTNQEYFKEQDKYDKDTEHGLNAAKQQVWTEDIKKRIKELDAYSSTEINMVK